MAGGGLEEGASSMPAAWKSRQGEWMMHDAWLRVGEEGD